MYCSFFVQLLLVPLVLTYYWSNTLSFFSGNIFGGQLSAKWAARGTSHCPKCRFPHSNAWTPKNCSYCSCMFEIGGKYVPKPKKLKVDYPQSVVVVDCSQMKLLSVKLNSSAKRTLVVNVKKMILFVTTISAKKAVLFTWPVMFHSG